MILEGFNQLSQAWHLSSMLNNNDLISSFSVRRNKNTELLH